MTIEALAAREILDSRGCPTLEVSIQLNGVRASASVPAGKSVGSHEAYELRDGESRFNGKGVLKAVAAVEHEIAARCVGNTWTQESLDAALCELDGTTTKERLGANALLGVSLAFARAAAQNSGMPLYRYIAQCAGTVPAVPQVSLNVINGGAHADSGLTLQEFMLVPARTTVAQELAEGYAVIEALRGRLVAAGLSVGVGDEGGFSPKLESTEAALDLLCGAIKDAGVSGMQVALDAAASSFYAQGLYTLTPEGAFTTQELLSWYEDLIDSYPIVSLEDPFAEDDWEGFSALVRAQGSKVRIVGDDLLATNTQRIEEALGSQAVNTVLLKPNQVGTLTETLRAASAGRRGGAALFASHRSGETNDDFIADLAVGLGCEYIKAGSLARGERVAKYNRLLHIAQEI